MTELEFIYINNLEQNHNKSNNKHFAKCQTNSPVLTISFRSNVTMPLPKVWFALSFG